MRPSQETTTGLEAEINRFWGDNPPQVQLNNKFHNIKEEMGEECRSQNNKETAVKQSQVSFISYPVKESLLEMSA